MTAPAQTAPVKNSPALPRTPEVYRCPKCDGVGKLLGVTTTPGVVELSFHCPYCQHKWAVKKDDQRQITRS